MIWAMVWMSHILQLKKIKLAELRYKQSILSRIWSLTWNFAYWDECICRWGHVNDGASRAKHSGREQQGHQFAQILIIFLFLDGTVSSWESGAKRAVTDLGELLRRKDSGSYLETFAPYGKSLRSQASEHGPLRWFERTIFRQYLISRINRKFTFSDVSDSLSG